MPHAETVLSAAIKALHVASSPPCLPFLRSGSHFTITGLVAFKGDFPPQIWQPQQPRRPAEAEKGESSE